MRAAFGALGSAVVTGLVGGRGYSTGPHPGVMNKLLSGPAQLTREDEGLGDVTAALPLHSDHTALRRDAAAAGPLSSGVLSPSPMRIPPGLC